VPAVRGSRDGRDVAGRALLSGCGPGVDQDPQSARSQHEDDPEHHTTGRWPDAASAAEAMGVSVAEAERRLARHEPFDELIGHMRSFRPR